MEFLLRIWRGSPDARRARALRRLFKIVRYSDAPEARGRRLLRRWLSIEQRAQFDALNCFEVIGCHTARRYRINYASAANVEELNEVGNPLMRLCFIPRGYLVPGDIMLAQKIALETDELAALAVANRFPPSAQFQFQPDLGGRMARTKLVLRLLSESIVNRNARAERSTEQMLEPNPEFCSLLQAQPGNHRIS